MRYWILIMMLAGCGPRHQAPRNQPQPAQPSVAASASRSQSNPGADPGERPPARDPDEPSVAAAVASKPPPRRGGVPVPSPPTRPSPTQPALSSEAQALVEAHNRVRAKHCAGPLAWSPTLAQVAQRWANSLRDKGCAFGHSNGSYGENLAAGSTGLLDPDAVVKMWYDESALYKFGRGGFSMQTGHFTQVVWRGTTQVGCGRSQCKGLDIWVCEYDPPGNWEGQYRENVLPRGCR